MFGRLLPKEPSFFSYFEQHAELTLRGVREFQGLATEGIGRGHSQRILEIEHQADGVTHRCIEALHRTFITPLDRDDIHQLISRMDDILDHVEAAAERITLYEVRELMPEVRDFAAVLVRAVEHVQRAVRSLGDKRRTKEVLEICIEINRIENEADALLRRALARLFREETDPLEVIKWKEIFEYLERATDVCEDVANLVEGIILEGN
ncbi:MAG: DUF47 domain-containing protein [Proteobacteria bacterium]|nr:DUF47 domain-containing protein [Pseudomonadota bacterium]